MPGRTTAQIETVCGSKVRSTAPRKDRSTNLGAGVQTKQLRLCVARPSAEAAAALLPFYKRHETWHGPAVTTSLKRRNAQFAKNISGEFPRKSRTNIKAWEQGWPQPALSELMNSHGDLPLACARFERSECLSDRRRFRAQS